MLQIAEMAGLHKLLRGTIFSPPVILARCDPPAPLRCFNINNLRGTHWQRTCISSIAIEDLCRWGDCNEEITLRLADNFAADGAGVSPASRHLRRVIPDLLFRTDTMNLTNNLFARRRVRIPGKKDYACAC